MTASRPIPRSSRGAWPRWPGWRRGCPGGLSCSPRSARRCSVSRRARRSARRVSRQLSGGAWMRRGCAVTCRAWAMPQAPRCANRAILPCVAASSTFSPPAKPIRFGWICLAIRWTGCGGSIRPRSAPPARWTDWNSRLRPKSFWTKRRSPGSGRPTAWNSAPPGPMIRCMRRSARGASSRGWSTGLASFTTRWRPCFNTYQTPVLCWTIR